MSPKMRRPTARARDDDFIMQTNDSSIVSKRSVSRLYYPSEPDFFQPFVQRFQRRNPLINRGYWLRMRAVEGVVHRFLQQNLNTKKVIVNLGCGYDPLPFQIWHRYQPLCDGVTFVDVDYPQLMQEKAKRILSSQVLRDTIHKLRVQSAESPLYLTSQFYMALGCDLRDLETLERFLRHNSALSSCPLLFIGEVSITYMKVQDADALIRWASTFPDAHFCLLEQYLPDGPAHPFAQTMLGHFEKLQTPLQAVIPYPTLDQHRLRFLRAGWSSLSTLRSLWDLWFDTRVVPFDERRRLDSIEPFDEWEEFALFASHYFLLVASNGMKGPSLDLDLQPVPKNEILLPPLNQDMEAVYVNVDSHSQTQTARPTPRRFAAACSFEKGTVSLHGGQGTQARLATADFYHRNGVTSTIEGSPPTRACMCHTITAIPDGGALMVGGRASPNQVSPETWHLAAGQWSRTDDLNPARFRHCSVRVTIPWKNSLVDAVLVFGGKTGEGDVLGDWKLWMSTDGWQDVFASGRTPSPRFGAAMATSNISMDQGLLLGGMSPQGSVLSDLWQWKIQVGERIEIISEDRSDQVPKDFRWVVPRFGSSLLGFEQGFLLVGGVGAGRAISAAEELLLMRSGSSIEVERIPISFTRHRPLLVGCGCVVISDYEAFIAGGGAVCFSMGSFWNEGYLTIRRRDVPRSESWQFAVPFAIKAAQVSDRRSPMRLNGRVASGPSVEVQRIRLRTRDEFTTVVGASRPVIFEELDLGRCTQLWTMDYLREHIGADRTVIVHSCPSDRMTFQDKNFSYVKKSFGDFIQDVSQGDNCYLRSVSASQPTRLPARLEDDFPTIASDFCLPDCLSSVTENLHSSPLRISGPVSLWLHYDVLANVLCQVKGTKSLRLFPPSDVTHLDYPPGGSSSNIDVMDGDPSILGRLHPYDALLRPGDVLFIPPMWSHTASPTGSFSIAVNVFFRNLTNGYAAGKDVYGNRDLQAYENGRRDVERIVKAFHSIPPDIRRFYLERLVAEMQDKIDHR